MQIHDVRQNLKHNITQNKNKTFSIRHRYLNALLNSFLKIQLLKSNYINQNIKITLRYILKYVGKSILRFDNWN